MLEGVANVKNSELKIANLVHPQHQLDHVSNLPPSGILPLSIGHLRQTWQTSDNEPVLLRSVGDPVVELGVDGDLAADSLLKLLVPAFQEHHPVLMMTNGLLDLIELSCAGHISRGQLEVGLVEEMEHVMKARDWGQENSIRHQVLTGEARQQVEVLGLVRVKDGRKPCSHLGQVLLVPGRTSTEQRRCEKDLE